MKLTQKRYIYSGVLSGLFFIICYIIIDLNIIFSLIITLICFIAGIFIFKEKDVISYDPEKIMDYYYNTSKLLNYSNFIKDEKINKLIKNIVNTSEEILKLLEQKPKRATQVYNFYDYYLELTLKIINKYNNVKETDKDYISKVDDYLININQAFEKQLNNLNKAKKVDIDKEIKLFEKIVNINDIEGSDIDV